MKLTTRTTDDAFDESDEVDYLERVYQELREELQHEERRLIEEYERDAQLQEAEVRAMLESEAFAQSDGVICPICSKYVCSLTLSLTHSLTHSLGYHHASAKHFCDVFVRYQKLSFFVVLHSLSVSRDPRVCFIRRSSDIHTPRRPSKTSPYCWQLGSWDFEIDDKN